MIKKNPLHLDAGETTFFARELEHVKSTTYDTKYKALKAKQLIPLDTSAPSGSDTITYRTYSKVGIAKMSRYAPDLVMMDWEMPEMDGFTALKKIKSDSKLNHIPVIMVTSKTEKAGIIEAIKAGADGYIIKPFHVDVVEEKINQVMAKKQS